MKSSPFLKSTFLLCSFLISFATRAQLVVTAGGTPQQIMNAFIGSGMTVSNVVLNCGTSIPDSSGYGTFVGTSSNIGLSNGILLTTGNVVSAVGPNNQAGAGYCHNFSPGPADPQLATIEPNAVYDLCVLQFDFIPHCSSILMHVVFGSEEYPEYVSSNVNDAFGIFLTGPSADCSNPTGYNNTNVAKLPNGTPISIDNINTGNWSCPGSPTGCTNCAYYVDNCAGTTVQYDGFTTPIGLVLNFCPCATYHMKIAIADAGDCVWDSGVFLDFITCASPFNYSVNSTNTCNCNGTASVNVSVGTPPYTYSWTPGGQTTQSISGLCAGNYSVSVWDAASCSSPVIQTFTISNTSTLALTDTTTDASCSTCSDGSITLNATGGSPAYSYSISPAAGTLSGNTFINVPPGNYFVCVTDSDSCMTCDSVFVDYTTSVHSLAAGQTIYFYPNPFSDKSVMRFNLPLNENAVIQITDALGRIIKELPITSPEIQVSRKDIPAEGIYFYRLLSGNSLMAKGKLVVLNN